MGGLYVIFIITQELVIVTIPEDVKVCAAVNSRSSNN